MVKVYFDPRCFSSEYGGLFERGKRAMIVLPAPFVRFVGFGLVVNIVLPLSDARRYLERVLLVLLHEWSAGRFGKQSGTTVQQPVPSPMVLRHL